MVFYRNEVVGLTVLSSCSTAPGNSIFFTVQCRRSSRNVLVPFASLWVQQRLSTSPVIWSDPVLWWSPRSACCVWPQWSSWIPVSRMSRCRRLRCLQDLSYRYDFDAGIYIFPTMSNSFCLIRSSRVYRDRHYSASGRLVSYFLLPLQE